MTALLGLTFIVLTRNNATITTQALKVTEITVLLTCNYVVKESGGHAENPNQEVTHSKVQDEQVGDSPHVFAPQHDEAHHSVSHHAHEEDQQVGHDEDGRCGRLMQVKSNIGDVVPAYDGLR